METHNGRPAYDEDKSIYGYDRVAYFRLLVVLGETNTQSFRKPNLSDYDGSIED